VRYYISQNFIKEAGKGAENLKGENPLRGFSPSLRLGGMKFEEDFKQSYTSCKVCDFSGYDSLVNFKTVGGWKEICLMKQRIEIKKMGMVL